MKESQIQSVIQKLTGRNKSFFEGDINNLSNKLSKEINNSKVLVIGGAGTIGSNFIKALLPFKPSQLVIVDINENGLAEIIRDLRSSNFNQLPEIITYPINFGSPIFDRLFDHFGPFDIVANFAAHKHVRSEKDSFSIQAMFENNFVMAQELLEKLKQSPPKHFFCVSTDKATQPVNVMGATKKLMEDVIFSYQADFKITTARFANVAFSNGSLLESFINRYNKRQALVCPKDIRRFFVSPLEAGQLCLIACICGNSGEIFIPKLSPEKDLVPISNALKYFIDENKINTKEYFSEKEVLEASLKFNDKEYPVFFPPSDTSGEKPIEEFYAPNDILDEKSFTALTVIKTFVGKQKDVLPLINEAKELSNFNLAKADLVSFLKKYVDGFEHYETGKKLDDKL